jgi:predicted small lipoprotein YifL
MPLRSLIIVLLAVAALTGCGRRGSLEAPPAATAVEPGATTTTVAPSDVASPIDPGAPSVAAPAPTPVEPARRRFFLDFLL